MTKLEEKLVEYIDDAYAMEQNVLRMLDSMIGTTKDPRSSAYSTAQEGSRTACRSTDPRPRRRSGPAV
jgi:ferritin-like metal-binding protein YciE